MSNGQYVPTCCICRGQHLPLHLPLWCPPPASEPDFPHPGMVNTIEDVQFFRKLRIFQLEPGHAHPDTEPLRFRTSGDDATIIVAQADHRFTACLQCVSPVREVSGSASGGRRAASRFRADCASSSDTAPAGRPCIS